MSVDVLTRRAQIPLRVGYRHHLAAWHCARARRGFFFRLAACTAARGVLRIVTLLSFICGRHRSPVLTGQRAGQRRG